MFSEFISCFISQSHLNFAFQYFVFGKKGISPHECTRPRFSRTLPGA